MAQDISINLGQGNSGVTERAIQLIALLTVLSIAPLISAAVKEVFEDGSVTSLFGGRA